MIYINYLNIYYNDILYVYTIYIIYCGCLDNQNNKSAIIKRNGQLLKDLNKTRNRSYIAIHKK